MIFFLLFLTVLVIPNSSGAYYKKSIKLYKPKAELYVANGADINAKNHRGQTILHVITEEPRLYVEDEGKIVDVRGGFSKEQMQGISCSSYRIMPEERDFLEFLLACNADINALDNEMNTPLYNAASFSFSDSLLFDCLLQHGADVNKGSTPPLLVTVYIDQLTTGNWTKKLLEHGALVNAQDSDGRTALHVALSWSNLDSANLLLTAGADCYLRDNNGKTPFDMIEQDDEKVLAWVQEVKKRNSKL